MMTSAIKEKTTAIIVDDERLAVKGIELLLADYSHIDIVGASGNIDGAVKLVQEHDPDILFLDIQLQGETGFDLFNRIQVNANVIFVTAYDTYAIRAFEVNALDYILKPVSRGRFRVTMDRISSCGTDHRCRSSRLKYDDVVVLNMGSRMRFVKVDQILNITAEGDYSRVCLIGVKDELVLKSMKAWEEILPLASFARIHRSTIINMDRVHKIEKTTSNRYLVYLPGKSAPLPMSQRYSARMRKKLSRNDGNIGSLQQSL